MQSIVGRNCHLVRRQHQFGILKSYKMKIVLIVATVFGGLMLSDIEFNHVSNDIKRKTAPPPKKKGQKISRGDILQVHTIITDTVAVSFVYLL